MLELALAVLFVIIASAICSGTEAALFSIPHHRAKEIGGALEQVKENLQRPIATIVIGNNIANIVGTFWIASIASRELDEVTQKWFPYAMTIAVIIFSEILPKNIGERNSTIISKLMARPIQVITLLCTPLVWVIQLIVSLFVKTSNEPRTNEGEVLMLTRLAHAEEEIDQDELVMIERVFILDDRTAKQIMTPRPFITVIDGNLTLEQAKRELCDKEHSRIVVIGNRLDDVRGFVLKSAMLEKIVREDDLGKTLSELAEEVLFVHESTKSDELLAKFQASCKHIAIVLDEFGSTIGVVTLEDVIEVVTGEIVDETDSTHDLAALARKNGRRRLEKLGALQTQQTPVYKDGDHDIMQTSQEAESLTTENIDNSNGGQNHVTLHSEPQ